MKMRNVYLKNTIIAIYNEKEKCLLEKYNNCNLQCLLEKYNNCNLQCLLEKYNNCNLQYLL